MSDLFWLTEAQIARLEPYFPKSHGKPRVDDRRILSGIVFLNCNGLRRRDARDSMVRMDALQPLEAVERHGRFRPDDGWPGRSARRGKDSDDRRHPAAAGVRRCPARSSTVREGRRAARCVCSSAIAASG
jgi:transposase